MVRMKWKLGVEFSLDDILPMAMHTHFCLSRATHFILDNHHLHLSCHCWLFFLSSWRFYAKYRNTEVTEIRRPHVHKGTSSMTVLEVSKEPLGENTAEFLSCS